MILQLITPHLVEEIKTRLRQPENHRMSITGILPHGGGVVVCYVVTNENKQEFRIAAMRRNNLGELYIKFDMTV